MRRRTFLRAAGGTTAGVVAAGSVAGDRTPGRGDVGGIGVAAHDGEVQNKDLHNGSFESGFAFEPWTVGTDLPIDSTTGWAVAVGVSVVWETYVRRLLDDVRLFRTATTASP